jgi:hypothetical protein
LHGLSTIADLIDRDVVVVKSGDFKEQGDTREEPLKNASYFRVCREE